MAPIRESGWDVSTSSRSTTIKYQFIRKLGEGGQGQTEVVRRIHDNKFLVRKSQKEYRMYGSIPEEMHIFKNILSPHPSIVAFDHSTYVPKDSSLVLYFEHCQGGDLHNWIPRSRNLRDEDFIWSVFTQLADALAFLHHGYDRRARNPRVPPPGWKPVVHRDVKPANVFLRYKLTQNYPMPDVVLGDFGIATLRSVTGDCGTKDWIGPELGSDMITAKSDVWALGAIMHALAHGEPPRAYRPRQLSSYYSKNLNDNMMDCLRTNPYDRVSSDSLVRHLQADKPRQRSRR